MGSSSEVIPSFTTLKTITSNMTFKLWDFFVLIPLVSAQVPHMSHLKGNIWYYHHHQYSPECDAQNVFSFPRTNFMTVPPLVKPNTELSNKKQTEELRSNARTSRRISSNFSKKVSGDKTIRNRMIDDVTEADNKTRSKEPSLLNLPPDAVLVGYEEESDEKTTFRTTSFHDNDGVIQEKNDPAYLDYRGKDIVVVQSLLRASSLLTTSSDWVTPRSRPRPVYDPRKKKVRRISPASTNITLGSPAPGGLRLLPTFPIVSENPKALISTIDQTNQTTTTATTTTAKTDPKVVIRAVKKEHIRHAKTNKLISGGESSMKTNSNILGIMIFSLYFLKE